MVDDTNKLFRDLAARQYDKYNTEDAEFDPSLFLKVVRQNTEFSPKEGQSLHSYIIEMEIRTKLQFEKNDRIHVDGIKGPWYTHRKDPRGCFMCEDRELYLVQLSVLKYISTKYPNLTF